jgi:hypothetical protein
MEDKKVIEARETAYQIRGLSGRCEWENIDALPLTELQKACVLEWLAQKLRQTPFAQKYDIWQYGKSYDPLLFDGQTAYSYVMNMSDGGRHHAFSNMAEVEGYIFTEFFEQFGPEENNNTPM